MSKAAHRPGLVVPAYRGLSLAEIVGEEELIDDRMSTATRPGASCWPTEGCRSPRSSARRR